MDHVRQAAVRQKAEVSAGDAGFAFCVYRPAFDGELGLHTKTGQQPVTGERTIAANVAPRQAGAEKVGRGHNAAVGAASRQRVVFALKGNCTFTCDHE